MRDSEEKKERDWKEYKETKDGDSVKEGHKDEALQKTLSIFQSELQRDLKSFEEDDYLQNWIMNCCFYAPELRSKVNTDDKFISLVQLCWKCPHALWINWNVSKITVAWPDNMTLKLKKMKCRLFFLIIKKKNIRNFLIYDKE